MKRLAGIVFRFAARALLVVVVVPVLFLIEPFFKLRVGTMYTQRFGHLALNAETFLRKMQLHGTPKRTFYFLFGHDPVNRQLMEMWKRNRAFPVRFVESRWGTRLMSAWRPILKYTWFWESHRITNTEHYLFNHTKPTLSFTAEEEARGRRGLAEMGIGADDWCVLFFARDGAFLRQWRPEQTAYWETRDFRNAEIDNYMKAAEYVASLGGYALRFGAVVEKPLPETGNPRIIDYATKHRSDFMDVYLFTKCRFFIGSASGPEALAHIFNVPVVSANHIPYNHTQFDRRSVVVPKLLAAPDGGRRVGFWEAHQAGYYVGWTETSTSHETMHLYSMLQSDPDDIFDGVRDMIDTLDGREPPAAAREVQDTYGRLYFSHVPEYVHAARIGARFALKYRDLIVPPDAGARQIEVTGSAPARQAANRTA